MRSSLLLLAALGVGGCALPESRPVVWVVGSPHSLRAETPDLAKLPESLAPLRKAYWVEVSASEFPRRLAMRWALGRPPDLILFTNYLPLFEAQKQESSWSASRLVEGLDADLPPWRFLRRDSDHHEQMEAMVLEATRPRAGVEVVPGSLSDVVQEVAAALTSRDVQALSGLRDPDSLAVAEPAWPAATVLSIQPQSSWGNDRLAFVQVEVQESGDDRLGRVPLLLVLRRSEANGPWRSLVITGDPISARLSPVGRAGFSSGFGAAESPPIPATLEHPPDGTDIRPGLPFEQFRWRTTPSPAVMEVAEFTYGAESRLFVLGASPEIRTVSSGNLWTTLDPWTWRVWSVDERGQIGFSESRHFFN